MRSHAVSAEGKDELTRSAEEAQVSERPGPGPRRAGAGLPQDAGPGAADHGG